MQLRALNTEKMAMVKRVQEEQFQNGKELKRYKDRILELKAELQKHSTKPVKTVFTSHAGCQTETNPQSELAKMQEKYDELKAICRSRLSDIRRLEAIVDEQKENKPLSSYESGQLSVLKVGC